MYDVFYNILLFKYDVSKFDRVYMDTTVLNIHFDISDYQINPCS